MTHGPQFSDSLTWGKAHISAHFDQINALPLWRVRIIKWLAEGEVDGQYTREVIIRKRDGLYAACKTTGQLLSLPEEYFASDSAFFYHFGKTYVCVDERRAA